jgi:hypothetical protein
MQFGQMENMTMLEIPQQALRRLEFLVGEFSGEQTLYPPGKRRVQYQAYCSGVREACERFTKLDVYASVPNYGITSFTAFLTYSQKKEAYEMWMFSSTSEEPLHMVGNFKGEQLVLVSDPWSMPWGLQRLRGTYTPELNGDFRYESELWEPDGYVLFRSGVFHRSTVPV